MLSAVESVFAYRFILKTIDMQQCFDMKRHICINAFTHVLYTQLSSYGALLLLQLSCRETGNYR